MVVFRIIESVIIMYLYIPGMIPWQTFLKTLSLFKIIIESKQNQHDINWHLTKLKAMLKRVQTLHFAIKKKAPRALELTMCLYII